MLGALIGRLYPACAATGTQGLPIPDPVSLTRLAEAAPRHAALAAPENFEIPPDIPTQTYAASAEATLAALIRIGTAQPRTWLAAAYPTRLQAHFVARSSKLNFPDIVVAETRTTGTGSVIVLYAQSVYGRSGAASQQRRLQDWLAALDAELATPSEGQD